MVQEDGGAAVLEEAGVVDEGLFDDDDLSTDSDND